MNLNKTYGSVEHGSSEGLSRVIKIWNGCHKSKRTVWKRRPRIESSRVIKIENEIEEHGVVCMIRKQRAVRRHVPDPVRTRLGREDGSHDRDGVPSLPLLLPLEEDADEGEDGGRSRCYRPADGGCARRRWGWDPDAELLWWVWTMWWVAWQLWWLDSSMR